MKHRILLTLLLITTSTTALAQGFMCPTTLEYVFAGASIDQVIAACGQPTTQSNREIPKTQKSNLSEWVYSKRKTPNTQLRVILKNGVVDALVIDGNVVESSTYCGTMRTLKKGLSQRAILNVCGTPGLVNQLPPQSAETIKETTLIYKPRAYMPATVFLFKDGKLISGQQVQ